MTSQVLVSSQKRFGIEVIGPAPVDVKWQAIARQGFDISQFVVDWEHQQAICPQGKTSPQWTPAFDSRGHQVFKIKFSIKDCGPCPCRSNCIHSGKPDQRRTITVCPQEQHEALQETRHRQFTPAFIQQYALRQGIEATISQGIRAFGMRRSRYIGLDKTHLQQLGLPPLSISCALLPELMAIRLLLLVSLLLKSCTMQLRGLPAVSLLMIQGCVSLEQLF